MGKEIYKHWLGMPDLELQYKFLSHFDFVAGAFMMVNNPVYIHCFSFVENRIIVPSMFIEAFLFSCKGNQERANEKLGKIEGMTVLFKET